MRAAGVHPRTWTRAYTTGLGAVFFLVAFGAVGALKALPYSTSSFSMVPVDAVGAPPTPDFQIGPLVWDVRRYAADPALEPFRRRFLAVCSGTTGLGAAFCAMRDIETHVPFGNPPRDFFAPDFDPAESLARHFAGTPGHCVTRSGILAAELLSVGIPARVVHVIPADWQGHTVVEVWDSKSSWVIVDPSLGIAARESGRAIVDDERRIVWARAPSPSASGPPSVRFADGVKHLVYPEPWLYLRCGPRIAHWPYRAAFVHVGSFGFAFGWGQTAFGLIAVAAALVGVTLFFWAARLRARAYDPSVDVPVIADTRRGVISGT